MESSLLYSENRRLFLRPLKAAHRGEGPAIILQMGLQSTCMCVFFYLFFFEGHAV